MPERACGCHACRNKRDETAANNKNGLHASYLGWTMATISRVVRTIAAIVNAAGHTIKRTIALGHRASKRA
jgi:hypothetical protein